MTASARALVKRLVLQEDLNFLLTNRIPRQLATRFMGWFSKIEHPWVRDGSIALWKLFTDLDLGEAAKRQGEFRSLHECFTRALKPGARTIAADTAVLASPSEGIVGECGRIDGARLFQAKGFAYTLQDLMGADPTAGDYANGTFVTLRLTSAMYHRFHAPHDCRVEQVTYFSGDTWNVNPIALKRVERLFCKNERALIRCRLDAGGHRIMLAPVAAILVAGIRLHFLDVLLHLRYKGPNVMPCDARLRKGEEMGWFEHGSTIIVFAPAGFELCAGVETGARIRMGAPLLRLPSESM